jgi:hypothetical protein
MLEPERHVPSYELGFDIWGMGVDPVVFVIISLSVAIYDVPLCNDIASCNRQGEYAPEMRLRM